MNKLFELGISENELKDMIGLVPDILNMSDEEVNDKINILKYVGCNERHIRNIFVSNPEYLGRINENVLKLIAYLNKNGFKNINLLFDSNPYFLNYDVFEIENYIDSQVEQGKDIEAIIDEIEDNPYIIDEG